MKRGTPALRRDAPLLRDCSANDAAAAVVVGIGVIVVAAAAVIVDAGQSGTLAIAAGREEGRDGEFDLAEHVAGALVGTGTSGGTVLGGDAIAVAGNPQLGIALHANDGELTDGDIQAAALTVEDQLTVKAAADKAGQLQAGVVVAAAVADIHYLAGEDHGIDDLHQGVGRCGLHETLTVEAVHNGLAAEGPGGAFTAAENDPLGEHRQAADGAGTSAADDGIHQNAVIISNVHRIVPRVELGRLHIEGDIQQLGTAGLDIGGLLQNGLGILGQEHPQILNAVLIDAGVTDFFGVDANGLTDAAQVVDCTHLAFLRHRGYLLMGFFDRQAPS